MASRLISDGTAFRIEIERPWRTRLAAFPLFCGAFYMFVAAFMGLKDLVAASSHGIGEYLSVVLFFLAGLACAVPASMIASSRHFIIDKARGEVCRILQIGPFKWCRRRRLSDFSVVTVEWEPDRDQSGATYFVTLSSGVEAGSVRIDSFDSAQPANAMARELGGALGLPVEDAPGRQRQRTASSIK